MIFIIVEIANMQTTLKMQAARETSALFSCFITHILSCFLLLASFPFILIFAKPHTIKPMNRRTAFRNITLATGAAVTLPAWSCNWKSAELPESTWLSPGQAVTLENMVEAIIPETNIPGAKSLGVNHFVELMVADCHDETDQINFVRGLEAIEKLAQQAYQKIFTDCATEQKEVLLVMLEQSENEKDKDFYLMVKKLTIQGFLSSEYIMTNHSNYQMVPDPYNGCSNVNNA